MRSLEENIESLSHAVLSEAREEAERILAEAREKADAIRKRAQEQAAAERAEILERANLEAARLRGQSVATTQMKARTMELEHRERLLDKVFEAARQQLPSIQQWSDYNQICQRLLKEALSQLQASDVLIQADQKTLSYLPDLVLNEISNKNNIHLAVGKLLENETGVNVISTDGHLHYDNTLEIRLNRLQNTLRSPVYHLLIGETL